jgi:SAM-dependent methyltransferase
MSDQHWDEKLFCELYADTWEISEEEVHYGWLAPGESRLQLIDIDLVSANILDIGCGMGENLIAMARKGANCHGIDISGHMLERAREKLDQLGPEIAPVHLQQQDMRQTDFFPGIAFDLILSAYSMEYLRSTQELKDLFYNLFKRLKPGGLLIFCFSHQLQHDRHNLLFNTSSKAGSTEFSPLIYSFRDVIEALDQAGYVIERVVEQGIQNPSQLSYDEALRYPYHFHPGKNPCHPQFDTLSNKEPHTIIYKARKLNTHGLQQDHQLTFNYQQNKIHIWGQNRSINHTYPFRCGDRSYIANTLAPKDAVVGLCELINFTVPSPEPRQDRERKLTINLDGAHETLRISANCIQSHLHDQLLEAGIQPIYARSNFHGNTEPASGLYIKRIDPIYGELTQHFPRQRLGILVFINGEEPALGSIGLEDITATPGDHIQALYIATSWGKHWRPRKRDNDQIELF